MERKINTTGLPKLFRTAAQFLGPELIEIAEQRLGKLTVACDRSSKCKRPERCPNSALCQMPANRRLQWHLREYILPGLAIYQALRSGGLSEEVALAKMNELIARVVEPQRCQMAWLGRFPLIYPLLRLIIHPIMAQYPAEGWDISWQENSQKAIRFNMHRCFYYDTLSRLGAPEMTAVFCRGDDLVYGQMSPYLNWKRTQTIGQGATYCDFCFANKNQSRAR